MYIHARFSLADVRMEGRFAGPFAMAPSPYLLSDPWNLARPTTRQPRSRASAGRLELLLAAEVVIRG